MIGYGTIRDDQFSREENNSLRRSSKRQKEMRVGRARLVGGDPTILALRRALDRERAALKAGKHTIDSLTNVVFRCLPQDFFHPVFLPADSASGPGLAIAFKPSLRGHMAFVAEYVRNITHDPSPNCFEAV